MLTFPTTDTTTTAGTCMNITDGMMLLTSQHRTCVAVAGNDYCIVAASTRLSTGFSILTRDGSRILKLYALG